MKFSDFICSASSKFCKNTEFLFISRRGNNNAFGFSCVDTLHPSQQFGTFQDVILGRFLSFWVKPVLSLAPVTLNLKFNTLQSSLHID